jgi:hypothetical protein
MGTRRDRLRGAGGHAAGPLPAAGALGGFAGLQVAWPVRPLWPFANAERFVDAVVGSTHRSLPCECATVAAR